MFAATQCRPDPFRIRGEERTENSHDQHVETGEGLQTAVQPGADRQRRQDQREFAAVHEYRRGVQPLPRAHLVQAGQKHAGGQAEHEGHSDGKQNNAHDRTKLRDIQGEAKVEEEERSENVAQRHSDSLDLCPIATGAEDDTDQERADRIRHPNDLAGAGQEHDKAEEEDGEEFVVLRAHEPGDDAATPPGQREHDNQEEECDAELQHDRPDFGLAAEHNGHDGEVDGDENVADDGHTEDHRRLLVRQPPEFDE